MFSASGWVHQGLSASGSMSLMLERYCDRAIVMKRLSLWRMSTASVWAGAADSPANTGMDSAIRTSSSLPTLSSAPPVTTRWMVTTPKSVSKCRSNDVAPSSPVTKTPQLPPMSTCSISAGSLLVIKHVLCSTLRRIWSPLPSPLT